MMPMANRLYEVLDKASFNYTIEEMESDIIEIESISNEDDDMLENKHNFEKIGNSLTDGIKNAGKGITNLFSKKNSDTEDNYIKIKKLKELLDIGAITEEEYEIKKKELL